MKTQQLYSVVVQTMTTIEVRADSEEAAERIGEARVLDAILAGSPLPGSSEVDTSWCDEMAEGEGSDDE